MKITVKEILVREVEVEVADNLIDPYSPLGYLGNPMVSEMVYDHVALNGWDHEEVHDISATI